MTVCLNLVLVTGTVFLCVSCGYLLLLTMVAAMPFLRVEKEGGIFLPLLVVVPAHNESGQIAETVDSILKSDYPSSQRRVLVLADNCDDETAEVARQAGALVVERCDPTVRGKGQQILVESAVPWPTPAALRGAGYAPAVVAFHNLPAAVQDCRPESIAPPGRTAGAKYPSPVAPCR